MTVAIPRNLGGTEVDLVTQVAICEIIGGACASTAWVMGQHIFGIPADVQPRWA
ncbi:MAG: hypothetical protein IH963_05400 [Chloroflexi bacterium]|nr:hypothetical protein [Chloroflexota bacterium]